MAAMIYSDEERAGSKLSSQAIWFFLHTFVALGSSLGLMALGYALNPPAVSQSVILGMSFLVPFAVGP